jgi:acyl-CoA reductase-like NAD-dependent aldehyde dehydrogenase
MLNDDRLKLVSLTGSSAVGHHAAKVVAERFGKTILELGGNNAIIVTPSANMDLAIRGILFGAVGTTGQRCTASSRVIVENGGEGSEWAAPIARRIIELYFRGSPGKLYPWESGYGIRKTPEPPMGAEATPQP